MIAAYNRVERELEDFLGSIPLEPAHLTVWSPILASIILEAGSELDSLWKLQLRASGSESANATIKEHFEQFGKCMVKKWLVVWSDEGQKISPFAPWDAISTFDLDFPVGLQLNICRRPPSAILHILTSAMRRTNSFPPRDRPFGHSLGVFAAILGRSIGVVAATLTDPSR